MNGTIVTIFTVLVGALVAFLFGTSAEGKREAEKEVAEARKAEKATVEEVVDVKEEVEAVEESREESPSVPPSSAVSGKLNRLRK